MNTKRQTYFFGALATLGSVALIVLIPLLNGPVFKSLDVIALFVPVAILLSLPLLRREGISDQPYFYFGIAGTVFLLWALVSALAVKTDSAMILTWVRYLFYLLLIPAIGLIAANEKRRTILLWALAFAGFGAALYGVYQHMHPQAAVAAFAIDSEISGRIFSTFDNPNFFSEFLILTISGTIALFATFKKKHWYIGLAAAVLIGVQIAALLFTYTRGSWLALLVGLVVAVFLFDIKIFAPLAALVVVVLPFVPSVLDRLVSSFTLDGSSSFRLGLWKVAGVAIANHPVFGAGVGNFYTAYREVVTTRPDLYAGYLQFGAHNSYFQLSAETGVLGGIAFLLMALSVCVAGIYLSSRIRNDRPRAFRNAAFTAGVVAFTLNALTSNSFQHPRAAVYFFILAGLLVGNGYGYWHKPAMDRVRFAKKPSAILESSLIFSSIKRGWLGSKTREVFVWIGSLLKPIGNAIRSFFERMWVNSLFRKLLFRDLPQTKVFAQSNFLRNIFGRIE